MTMVIKTGKKKGADSKKKLFERILKKRQALEAIEKVKKAQKKKVGGGRKRLSASAHSKAASKGAVTSDFAIAIDFVKGSGSPSRVFRAMSDLIDALQTVDRSLVKSIDTKIEPVIMLEDVETGSIKAWLKQAINSVDDEGLKKGDWKMVVGNYLLRCKYLVIRFLDKKVDIKSPTEIAELEREILKAAEETDVKQFPAYEPPSREKLVYDIAKINEALEPLNDEDKAEFISNVGNADFNLSLHISPETIQDLITSEMIQSTSEMIMKVKKPDFLGESQWEFRHDNRNILARILDERWLGEFQNGLILVRPGDAVRAEVLTEVRYGFDREVVSTQYSVLKVIQVIHDERPRQKTLFKPGARMFALGEDEPSEEAPPDKKE